MKGVAIPHCNVSPESIILNNQGAFKLKIFHSPWWLRMLLSEEMVGSMEERQPFAELEKTVLDLNVKELKIESQN